MIQANQDPKRGDGAVPAVSDRSFDHRLLAYALGGGAAVFSATSADAVPISSGLQNVQVASLGYPNSNNYVTVHLDPTDVTSPDFVFGWDDIGTYSAVGLGSGSVGNVNFATLKSSSGSAINYAAGSFVDATVPSGGKYGVPGMCAWYDSDDTYDAAPGSGMVSNWAAGGSGYVGFSFQDGSALTHYGWLEVSVPSTSAVGEFATLVQWAYESDPGTSIQVPVPEIAAGSAATAVAAVVGTLGLLERMGFATGAAGLRAWRKRRTAIA